MIAALAFAFMIGASAVYGDERCAQVQKMVLDHLKMFELGDVVSISHSNLDIGINFQRHENDEKYGETHLVVKPDQTPPIITLDDKSYKLYELMVTKVNQAAYLTVIFSEDAFRTYFAAVNVIVPLILTEDDKNGPNPNPWIKTDLRLLGGLPMGGGYKVNSMYWLQPLLEKAIQLTPYEGVFKYFMTACQSVPTYAVEEFFKIKDESAKILRIKHLMNRYHNH